LKLSKTPRNSTAATEQVADANMLEAINLSKTYTSDGGDYNMLKNVNLQIRVIGIHPRLLLFPSLVFRKEVLLFAPAK
jgi:hypothetical protein